MPTQRFGLIGLDLFHASLAQSVEHAAVNRRVVGSSPTGGATKEPSFVHRDKRGFFVFLISMGVGGNFCIQLIDSQFGYTINSRDLNLWTL